MGTLDDLRIGELVSEANHEAAESLVAVEAAVPEEVEQSSGGAREQEEVDRRRRMRVGERTPSRFREKNDEIKNRRGGRREQRTCVRGRTGDEWQRTRHRRRAAMRVVWV